MLARLVTAVLIFSTFPAHSAQLTPPPTCGSEVASGGGRSPWWLRSVAIVGLATLGAYLAELPPFTRKPTMTAVEETLPRISVANAADVPPPLKKAAASTFRLGVLADDPVKGMATIPWELHEERIRAVPGRPATFLEDWLRSEGERARAAGMARCPTITYGVGSAFLVGDGDILVTALHNLDGTPFSKVWNRMNNRGLDRWKAHAAELSAVTPPLVLFDADGKIVFDTRRQGDRATIASLPHLFHRTDYHLRPPDTVEELTGQLLSDFVAFRLNRRLGDGLPFLKLDGARPDQLAAIGFPGPKSTPFVTDGFHQYVSLGRRMRSRDFLLAVRPDEPPAEVVKQTDMELLFSDLFQMQGMSGGPVLDANGNVLSINTRGGKKHGVFMAPAYLYRNLTPERMAEVEALMRR